MTIYTKKQTDPSPDDAPEFDSEADAVLSYFKAESHSARAIAQWIDGWNDEDSLATALAFARERWKDR